MIDSPMYRIVSAVLVSWLTAGCGTLANGSHQPLLVVSDPPGAMVMLSERPVGETPVTVKVSRRRPGPVAVTLPCGQHSVRPTSSIDPLAWLYVPLVPMTLIPAAADYLAGGLSRLAPDHIAAVCLNGRPTSVVPVQAQMIVGLGSGHQIRVAGNLAADRFLVGQLASVTSDSLTIIASLSGERLTIHRAAIRELQLSRGHHRSTGMLIGAVVGGALGVALGVMLSDEPLAPAGVALFSAPVGMIMGYALAPQRWQRLAQ